MIRIWIRKQSGCHTASDYILWGMRWPKATCNVVWTDKPENDANKLGWLEAPRALVEERFGATALWWMIHDYQAEEA